MNRGALLVSIAVAACTSSEADTARPKPLPDPCSAQALKLGTARPLGGWSLPAGCTVKGHDRSLIRTQAALDAVLECPKTTPLGLDLTRQALVYVAWNMSPAAVGLDALDDGKQLTLVTRFRRPCPKDPRPMPMVMNRFYLLPAGGAERTFGEASCTIDTKCP